MGRYAIVEDDKVKNIVLWDGRSDWLFESDNVHEANNDADIGWYFDGKNFTPPPEPYVDKQ